MEILRFAKQSLETCECRHLTQKKTKAIQMVAIAVSEAINSNTVISILAAN